MSSEYVKHEILLPKELSREIPRGSRLVWRQITEDCKFISAAGPQVCRASSGQEYRIIIEPAWQAPDWMPKGWWLAMDADGEWCLYEHKPEFHDGEYWWHEERRSKRVYVSEHFNWTPPTVDGAEDSLRQI